MTDKITIERATVEQVLEHAQLSFASPGWTLVRNEDISAIRKALAEQALYATTIGDGHMAENGFEGRRAEQPAQQEPVAKMGMYEHKCPNVTGHRGPSFVCQKAGHGVGQNSYCKNCTCPEALNTSPPASKPWVPVTQELLHKQHPWLYEPMWIAMKDGSVIQGHYEWRQGWNPDRFIAEGFNHWAFDAAYVMPVIKPTPPAIEATIGITGE